MKYYLIMTSDERTWKFDRPVIFLGEWCRHYKRKHIWSKMDAIVAEPYGVSAEEKMKDRKLVVSLYNDLIGEVTIIMNQLHGTNHKARYWTILFKKLESLSVINIREWSIILFLHLRAY